VALGVATALYDGYSVNWVEIILVVAGALAAHISVNALNEYSDCTSGLDFKTKKTPFSGGSGVLPTDPGKAHYALATGLTALALCAAVGVYFVAIRGLALLPLGLAGIVVIVLYTRWLTRSVLLCLIAPGLGFGTFMVLGTHCALTGEYSVTAAAASLVPFFLVSNLLLLNQFPDREADAAVGRAHILVRHDPKVGAVVYVFFLAAAYAVAPVGWLAGMLPAQSLLACGGLVLAVPAAVGAIRFRENIPRLLPYMGLNVALNLVTPLLLAAGLIWAR